MLLEKPMKRSNFMNADQLLNLLYQQKGSHISGEVMSQTLGVSRSAVWKGISSLREQGYVIESSTKKGYFLKSSPYFVEIQKISPYLIHQKLGNPLIYHMTIDSTNTHLKQLALEGTSEGTCVLSSEQTAGKGRRGRSFHSPAGLGVYMSVLLRPALSISQIMELTPWVAVAVCQGIFQCTGVSAQIKWTNDIVVNGKKLCGILTELGLESDAECLDYVVVGIGTNLAKGDFPPEISSIATSLEEVCGHSVDQSDFCVALLQSLDRMYQNFPEKKEEYLDYYRNACISTEKEVQVHRGEQIRPAFATHIDEEFRLCVRYLDGNKESEALATGEVSVRGMYGYV